MVTLEVPIEEAEAGLGALTPGKFSDREALLRFEARLRQAVLVERGSAGDHEDAEALAKHLLGRDVRVTTSQGEEHIGYLGRLSGWHSIVLRQGNSHLPINLSHVVAIEPLEQAA